MLCCPWLQPRVRSKTRGTAKVTSFRKKTKPTFLISVSVAFLLTPRMSYNLESAISSQRRTTKADPFRNSQSRIREETFRIALAEEQSRGSLAIQTDKMADVRQKNFFQNLTERFRSNLRGIEVRMKNLDFDEKLLASASKISFLRQFAQPKRDELRASYRSANGVR